MLIEQQQILTTQNLAALFSGLGLTAALRGVLGAMAMQCFKWICQLRQVKIDKWHARLIMIKNTAYAWRQMIFFLALLSKQEAAQFPCQASEHLVAQSDDFVSRFRPALEGLVLAAEGPSIDGNPDQQSEACRFLGWSKDCHWLLAGD